MKKIKILLISLFLLSSISSYSQGYWRIGYNFAGLISSDFKYLIDVYNDYRPTLDNKMDYPGISKGIMFGWGYTFEKYNFSNELFWSNQHYIMKAGGIDPVSNKYSAHLLKLRYNMMTYLFDWQLRNRPNFHLGFTLDWGRARVFQKTDDAAYSWLDDSFIVSDKIFVSFEVPSDSRLRLQLQPFLRYDWWIGTDLAQLEDVAKQQSYTTNTYYIYPLTYGLVISAKIYSKGSK